MMFAVPGALVGQVGRPNQIDLQSVFFSVGISLFEGDNIVKTCSAETVDGLRIIAYNGNIAVLRGKKVRD